MAGNNKKPNYEIIRCDIGLVRSMCERYHGYKSAGRLAVYAFAVIEDGEAVAAYAWQPPPIGASRSICPEQPSAVLALSRMVAVPRSMRRLNHVSRPLRYQMKNLIDRGRWPVLVTYHDESQGHNGHVYKCSGWKRTRRSRAPVYEISGVRVSSYSAGKTEIRGKKRVDDTFINRWEHWACNAGEVAYHMARSGWRRVPIKGRYWRSGAQAYTWIKVSDQDPQLALSYAQIGAGKKTAALSG